MFGAAGFWFDWFEVDLVGLAVDGELVLHAGGS
jgi:hypothetical protein